MATDIVKLLGISAGFLMIISATVLAFRQSITWQHVVVFCLGGVLAGISGVQLQGGTDWRVTIGQLADATDKAGSATVQQADAITALNKRIDEIQASLARISAAGAGAAAANSSKGGSGPPPPSPVQPLSGAVDRAIENSRINADAARNAAQAVQRSLK